MGAPVPGGRGRRSGGPVLQTPSAAQANTAANPRADPRSAPAAVHRSANRAPDGRLTSHGEPHPAGRAPEPDEGFTATRARGPLRTQDPGRADPPRYQKARPLRANRPPHNRRSNPTEQLSRPQGRPVLGRG